jgi:hypothetical protein
MKKRRQEPARQPGRFRSRRLWILIFAGLLLWTGVLSRDAGANGGDDLDTRRGQGEHPAAPATTGPIITDTTIPQALGTASLFMPGFFSATGANFSPGWRRVSPGGDYRSLTAQMQLFYGLLPRTEVYVVVPYTHNWAANVDPPAPNGQGRADFGGLGDVRFTGKYLLLDEQPHLPAVSGVLTATFPTGHHRRLNPGNLGTDQLGQGAFSFTPGLTFFKYAPPVLLYANVLYTLSTGATVAGSRTYYPDQVRVNLAMEYPLPGTRFVLLWELVSNFDAGRLIGPRANQSPQALVSTLPGLEFMVNKDFACVAGVLVDLAGKNTTCAVSPNFSVFYYF